MKNLFLVCLFFVTLGATFAKPVDLPEGLEGIDVDEVLSNVRLLQGYIKCVLGQSPCTPEGKKLKELLPKAIENECEKCTTEQEATAKKVSFHIIDNLPDMWKQLESKYDPSGNYKKKMCEKMKNNGEDTKNAC